MFSNVNVAQSAAPHIYMFPQLMAGARMKYLVDMAQFDVVSSHRCVFLLSMTTARVCKIFVDKRAVHIA